MLAWWLFLCISTILFFDRPAMMTTQPYYGGGGEYEPFHRPSPHRSLSSGTGTYYERPAPYGYYDQPRQDFRSDYVGRPTTRIIHEPEPDAGHPHARRRIAVAVSNHVDRCGKESH